MQKPTVFYFVHAHGNGHRATFNMLYPEFSAYFNVVVITTNSDVSQQLRQRYAVEVVELPPKYPADFSIPEHTFSRAFEVTPYAVEPAERARAFAEAILHYQPKAFYCDGVPELAIMARGMGLPVVLVHLPGQILQDPTQIFAHELADHIVAHFPEILEQEDYPYKSKTFYSGYLSRFSTEKCAAQDLKTEDTVTVLLGYDNCDEAVLQKITHDPATKFIVIGNKKEYFLGENCRQLGFVEDIETAVSGKRVISAAGQNTVAELLSLDKTLILLPEPRPYDEQLVHAEMLFSKGVALLAHSDFSALQWKNLLFHAKNFKPNVADLVNNFGAKEVTQKMRDWYGTV